MTATVRLQVLKQGFRRPPVTGGVPVGVVLPSRIPPGFGALADDVVVVVNDGNASWFGQSGQAVESEVAPGADVCEDRMTNAAPASRSWVFISFAFGIAGI